LTTDVLAKLWFGASLLVHQNARLLLVGAARSISMAQPESIAVRNANRHFRKEEQAKDGASAWKQYLELEDATRQKTVRLRAQRLAREATDTPVPLSKPAGRTASKKR
jgi:hypothetical protein